MSNPTGQCEHCGRTFRFRIIHNGFNDSAYAYCDECSFTVHLSGWTQAAKRTALRIHQRITPDLETLLKPCPCGGTFRSSADPKCPHCAKALSPVTATSYIERDAPGTEKGWHWQQSWSGIYSIVLNESLVEDWWDQPALDRLFPQAP